MTGARTTADDQHSMRTAGAEVRYGRLPFWAPRQRRAVQAVATIEEEISRLHIGTQLRRRLARRAVTTAIADIRVSCATGLNRTTARCVRRRPTIGCGECLGSSTRGR